MLLASFVVLSGCTINVYHASSSNPAMVDNSMLVIPEAKTKLNGSQPASSKKANSVTPQLNSQLIPTVAVGLERSKIKTPNEVLNMSAKGSGTEHSVKYMDSVGLEVQSMVDAYLNCYHEQADGAIVKVFPNRYFKRYWVYASQQLTFPDEKYFRFVANSAGASEGFMCLASSEDVLSKLPKVYQANVFQKLPVKNFNAVYALYQQATEENLVGRVISYKIQE